MPFLLLSCLLVVHFIDPAMEPRRVEGKAFPYTIYRFNVVLLPPSFPLFLSPLFSFLFPPPRTQCILETTTLLTCDSENARRTILKEKAAASIS